MNETTLDTVLSELVIANRILANEGVVDAYGHVSVRHPTRPDRFFMARMLAPELVERGDLMEFGPDGKARKITTWAEGTVARMRRPNEVYLSQAASMATQAVASRMVNNCRSGQL